MLNMKQKRQVCRLAFFIAVVILAYSPLACGNARPAEGLRKDREIVSKPTGHVPKIGISAYKSE